jgi:hypothetical protein
LQQVGNTAAGLVRGVGSIGATLLAPVDIASDALDGKGFSLESNRQRRAAMDGGLQELGADPESAMYQVGKLTGEIAGTLPVGGVVGRGVAALGAPRLGAAVSSAGFRTGAPAATTLAGRAGDIGIRAAGGAISGGMTAATVDPSQAVAGAAVGAVAPPALRALGAAGSAVGKVAGATGRGVRAAIEPFTPAGRQAIASRVLVQAAGDDAPTVATRLAQAGELVPGSVPTAGQVAENGGVAALERSMVAANPAPYTERALEQSAARLEAMRGIAGDVGQREFFATARKRAAEELYERAFAVPIVLEDLSPAMRGEIQKLMAMPAIQQGIKAARKNAQDHGMRLDNVGSVSGLHQAKLALDDMISELAGPGVTGAQANRAAAIRSARDRLVTFMERMSPDYAEARATYAAMSAPINQLDVGQALLEKMQPALAEHGAHISERAATFAQALRAGDQLTRKATGRNLRMDQVLTPEQMQVMDNVARDLARKSNAENMGRGVGSDTFQKIVMNNLASRSGLPPRVARALPATVGSGVGAAVGGAVAGVPGGVAGATLGKALDALYGAAEGRVQQEVSRSLLQPQTAAQMMQAEIARQARLNAPRQPMISQATRDGLAVLFGRTSPLVLTGQ